MRTFRLLRLTMAIAAVFLAGACVPGGEVVKVTIARDARSAGLKEKDLEKLQELKKAREENAGLNTNLSTVIEKTPHFSVAEYIKMYPEAGGKEGQDYRVGGYDVLNITVYEESDLSREVVRISADGYISFPLIGRIRVDNLTTSEMENLISAKLAEGQYLLNAHVSIMVIEYNSKRFLVLGAVKIPGSYPLRIRERVLDAISKAGGVQRAREHYQEQAGKKGMINRTVKSRSGQGLKLVINLDLQGLLEGRDQVSNLFLKDQDVIFIPSAEHFYIIGEVKDPGSYPITDQEITLVEAISKAGGFTPIASRNRTRIIRIEKGVEKIIEVKVDAITSAGKKIQDVTIRANDVIVVPESFF